MIKLKLKIIIHDPYEILGTINDSEYGIATIGVQPSSALVRMETPRAMQHKPNAEKMILATIFFCETMSAYKLLI